VLDAVGSQRTAILAELDAAAIFFAGTRPERSSASATSAGTPIG
jgi:hypothetical protein